MVEDLGSTNGTYLNRKKVTGPTVMHRGDQVQVGNVVLEVR
jgi:pSer/pThr/pTyr-binding forkhead associated (FHA) protein